MSAQFDGRTVLVIGGSRFLGEAVARKAAELGASVVIGARDLTRASEVAATIGAKALRVDLNDEATIACAAGELAAVDHIVMTASASHNVAVTELELDKLQGAFQAKVFGPLLVAKHFAPIIRPGGSLVLFSGVVAWTPGAPFTIMGTANGAVAFLATHLAKELAPVRVNAVSPGIIDSGTWDRLGAEAKQRLLDNAGASTLVGRTGLSDDIVSAVTWLMGSGFVSGETIHVEGGARYA